MLTFFSDSPLHFVQKFPVIASETEEEFDFSPSNVAFGVQISNALDILEKISYYRIDPFTLINLEIPVNSYRIACTKNQNFEGGENCASTTSMENSFGTDMNLFGSDLFSDMIIFGSGFKIQEISVLLVTGFINFGVNKSSTTSLLQFYR